METKLALFDLSGALDRNEKPEEVTLYSEPLEWQKKGLQYTATGYGTKIPTSWVLYHNKKRYRVYCDIYSNVGNTYVVINGQKVSID